MEFKVEGLGFKVKGLRLSVLGLVDLQNPAGTHDINQCRSRRNPTAARGSGMRNRIGLQVLGLLHLGPRHIKKESNELRGGTPV